MRITLQELLAIYKTKQLEDFLRKYVGYTLEEKDLSYKMIRKNWSFVGNNSSNGSVINMVKNGEKGIVERITNAIDAVIEKQKRICQILQVPKSENIIQHAFPKYYEMSNDVLKGYGDLSCYDADNQVIVAISDGSKSSRPTFDIIDKGIGIKGSDFIGTILSINAGNKLSKEKGYLIGAFGQGGSTSLPFAEATIIVSKHEDKYYFTIVRSVDLQEYKNYCFVYLIFDQQIPELVVGDEEMEPYIQDFIDSDSGTLIRMVETDITKDFREYSVATPGSFGDYVNTELFDVHLPVKIIENRMLFKDDEKATNIFGSHLKLHNFTYARPEFSGSILINHRGNPYKIDYYFVLPNDESKWCNDTECRELYKQVNVHLDPIIYTVNGQYISGEKFSKLKNAGLNFLQYRLLVVIDLDILGTEKYRFFTSDRSQIRDSDLTRGFIDTVISKLKNEEKIQEINNVIAKNSVNSLIDNEIITNISNKVKRIYNKYLQGNAVIKINTEGEVKLIKEEEVFYDNIAEFNIVTTRKNYYKDQTINVMVKTGANKVVNEAAETDVYIDGRRRLSFTPTIMNGKIQYAFTTINPGDHRISVTLLEDDKSVMKTGDYEFTVLNENSPEKVISDEKIANRMLNLKIIPVAARETIVDIVKNQEKKSIVAYICLEHDSMNEVYGRSSSNDIQVLKNKLIEPIVLFALSMGEKYDSIESDVEKNDLIVSLSKTIAFSLINK